MTQITATSYSYASNGFLATISLADEAMIAGRFYQFSYTAVNKVNESNASSIVTVPIADAPQTPQNL